MDKYENVYLKKVTDNKYELITKDLELIPKVYKLFVVDGMIILKPTYYYQKKPEEGFESADNKEKYKIYNKDYYYKKKEYSTMDVDYIVCDDQNQAKEISQKYSDEIKEGLVLGIKGFDRRYYIFKTTYYQKLKSLIVGVAKTTNKETSLEKLIDATKEPEDALKGVIEIMKEEGYLFEKNKIYKLIE